MNKILLFFPHNPFLLQNGVQTRFYNILCYFKEKNIDVDLVTHTNFCDQWEEKHKNSKLVNNIYFNDFKKSKESHITKNTAKLVDFAFDDLKMQIDELISKNNYSYIIVPYVHWAKLVLNLNKNIIKIIMIEDFISINQFQRNKGKYDVGNSINEEIKRISFFDHAICISNFEMKFFQSLCENTKFHYIPHFLESNKNDKNDKKYDIVFVGSDNPFNIEGIKWFLKNVQPIIDNKYNLTIIGKVNEHLGIYKEQFNNVNFINYIDDLSEIYENTKVVIAPLFGGTGTKIKLIEALSFSIPIVGTKFSFENISEEIGMLEANDSNSFIDYLELLLTNKIKYTKLSNNAEIFFKKNFSKTSIFKELNQIFLIP